MKTDRNKIIKMVLIIGVICILVSGLTRVSRQHSLTLEDYARQNPDIAYQETTEGESISDSDAGQNAPVRSTLPGAALNSSIPVEQRTLYSEGFYYEPLSENLQRYITGISYPVTLLSDTEPGQNTDSLPNITYDDLRYVHIWHYDLDGAATEGELICNQAIAGDLTEIFYELYRNEYRIGQVRLIDEFNGDYAASMENNNTFCFYYQTPQENPSLSRHEYGLAVDINPLYNPCITYNANGTEQILPASAESYTDRNRNFPYKIDENDLCYQLFKEHGFIWGGSFNSHKDYQHFQMPQ
ncbi:MAG: M15 family metallopeptidase [Bacteroidales bacterium]|nr:M15 family metallopeptidase [Lachnoclostridium sp.]MCM1383431.1 M15 family metallopeptidase [Lachnoclostridium sp.]MCM1464280.1 M15 family metallopeptidase [Bacteroidales bacterium]